MTNIQEFKNKLQEYQEGTDYIYDESKKTYIIRREELKNAFWGDASNEVEYKVIEDSRGNMQFQKSAIFRSSKEKKEGVDQAPFVHSVEKMRDKQWKEKNLGNFPKTIPTLPPNSQNEKDNSQMEANFPTGIEEEFGYYKQGEGGGRPLTEPINTVYHGKREKDVTVIEKKKVGKDNGGYTSPINPQITDISDDMEIEEIQRTNKSKKVETKATEVEVSQQQVQKQQFYKGVGE